MSWVSTPCPWRGAQFPDQPARLSVPMAVEEPSVVAAAPTRPHGARRWRVLCHADPPVMIAQIELRDVADPAAGTRSYLAARAESWPLADSCQGRGVLVSVGGVPRDLEVRHVTAHTQSRLVVHLHVTVATPWAPTRFQHQAKPWPPAGRTFWRPGRSAHSFQSRRPARGARKVPCAFCWP